MIKGKEFFNGGLIFIIPSGPFGPNLSLLISFGKD